jgi:hypothetical protein
VLSPAGVAELVDAPDSKSGSGNRVGVRFPPPAPTSNFFHARGRGPAGLRVRAVMRPGGAGCSVLPAAGCVAAAALPGAGCAGLPAVDYAVLPAAGCAVAGLLPEPDEPAVTQYWGATGPGLHSGATERTECAGAGLPAGSAATLPGLHPAECVQEQTAPAVRFGGSAQPVGFAQAGCAAVVLPADAGVDCCQNGQARMHDRSGHAREHAPLDAQWPQAVPAGCAVRPDPGCCAWPDSHEPGGNRASAHSDES